MIVARGHEYWSQPACLAFFHKVTLLMFHEWVTTAIHLKEVEGQTLSPTSILAAGFEQASSLPLFPVV